MDTSKVSLVIFTCEGREHLLKKTYQSFSAACGYRFEQVILAVDGVIDSSVINEINPDLVVNTYERKGYVISIKNTLVNIKTEFFFWLEDDWFFHSPVDVPYYIGLLQKHPDWAEAVYSKYGPLADEFKKVQLGQQLYLNINGYSTNPSFNRTALIRQGFEQMDKAAKKDGEREIGFENFLTGYFKDNSIKYALIDPVGHSDISHEGYLESTPRNWHMMSSLDKKTDKHLLIFPTPNIARRLYMVFKLLRAFIGLAVRQLSSDEVYELCFRIIAINIATKEGAKTKASTHHSNG
jgi:hypothetical protein